MFELILGGLFETLTMVALSSLVGVFLGVPLGVLLFMTGPRGLAECRWAYQLFAFLVNSVRSIPYIILTVVLIPLTTLLVGSSIGTLSASVPLSICGLLLIARVVEDALRNAPQGLIETGLSMGATKRQIITKILIRESLPTIISGTTLVTVSVTGFSAMAGAVGGGGLGDIAIRYGYQRYNLEVLIIVVILLIVLVQFIQFMGDRLAHYVRR